MQLELPFFRIPAPDVSGGSAAPPPLVSDPAVEFVRVRRARRYIVRVRPDGSVHVTLPRWGSKREAQAFLEKQHRWIERERQRVAEQHAPPEWRDGSVLLLRGEAVTITVDECHAGRTGARYGDRAVVIDAARPLRPQIEADLCALARDELVPRLHELAAAHGITVRGASVRNQRSRWGSCSRSGTIALNFRLVQMPPEVRDYVLLHELMHVRQQNHSRRFWRLVEAACPSFRDAERWLKVQGKALF